MSSPHIASITCEYGSLFLLRDSMSTLGVIRASSWEDAYEIAEDKFFLEAGEPTWEDIAKECDCADPEKLMDDAVFQENYGFRPNGASVTDKHGHGAYQRDPNGEALDAVTEKELHGRFKMTLTYHPHITTSYAVVTPESAEEGDYTETGWEDEDGQSMVPDKWETEEGWDCVALAIDFLKRKGAVHASSGNWHPGLWYSTEPEQACRDGSETTCSLHLHGFSEEEQRKIFDAVTKR